MCLAVSVTVVIVIWSPPPHPSNSLVPPLHSLSLDYSFGESSHNAYSVLKSLAHSNGNWREVRQYRERGRATTELKKLNKQKRTAVKTRLSTLTVAGGVIGLGFIHNKWRSFRCV